MRSAVDGSCCRCRYKEEIVCDIGHDRKSKIDTASVNIIKHQLVLELLNIKRCITVVQVKETSESICLGDIEPDTLRASDDIGIANCRVVECCPLKPVRTSPLRQAARNVDFGIWHPRRDLNLRGALLQCGIGSDDIVDFSRTSATSPGIDIYYRRIRLLRRPFHILRDRHSEI